MSQEAIDQILRVGLIQMNSVQDPKENLIQIFYILNSMKSSVDLFLFPENSLFFFISKSNPFLFFNSESQELKELQNWVDLHRKIVLLGGVPFKENDDQTKPYNSFIILKPGESIKSYYNKIHLFKINSNDSDSISVNETNFFQKGESPQVFEWKGWKFGLSICYDLRFSELYSYYASCECDAFFIPSSFLMQTGQAHWHTLLRARAIESQCYVIASAQGGVHKTSFGDEKYTFGHALGIDPWGAIQEEFDHQSVGVKIIQLEKTKIQSVRNKIPMKLARN